MHDLADRLIIFARYPEPGRVKTRQIPAIGPIRACRLHDEMTGWTIRWARALARADSVDVAVYVADGALEPMREHFGRDLSMALQRGSDLGQRMLDAFQRSKEQGAQRTIIVGTDAPSLNANYVRRAFDVLARRDVVVGPAWDGGYTLIGLRQPIPELFQGIAWGTDSVLESTLAVVNRLGRSVGILDPLGDVDDPTDLVRWTTKARAPIMPTDDDIVSVVIPTKNEASQIDRTLESVQADGVEAIVVDAASTDGTPERVERWGVRCWTCADGRAAQLNLGAAIAKGTNLLFLHADTVPPKNFARDVRETLAENGVAGGAFSFRIDERSPSLRAIEWGTNIRSRYLGWPYGDQGIFTTARRFWEVGGYDDWPILEDVGLIHKLRQMGKIRVVRAPAVTSGRRWKELGVWKTWCRNQAVLVGHWLGIPPSRLAGWYRRGTSRP